MLLNCGIGEDSREFLGLQGDPMCPSRRKLILNIHWKDSCWSSNYDNLATWCEEQTHWKRPWCWERLEAGGEGDDRGWDGCTSSLTQLTWVWVNSRSWWWTEKPVLLQTIGSQRVGHDWVTELTDWLTHSSILAGKFHRLYSLWGCKESDMTEGPSLSLSVQFEVSKATFLSQTESSINISRWLLLISY